MNGEFRAYAPTTPGDWFHLTWVYHGPSLGTIVYHDGVKIANGSSIHPKDNITTGDGRVVVGRYYTEKNSLYRSVQLDELVLWNRELSDEEVETVFKAY